MSFKIFGWIRVDELKHSDKFGKSIHRRDESKDSSLKNHQCPSRTVTKTVPIYHTSPILNVTGFKFGI
jgi:hypothetical protein